MARYSVDLNGVSGTPLWDQAHTYIVNKFGDVLDYWGRGEIEMSHHEAHKLAEFKDSQGYPIISYLPLDASPEQIAAWEQAVEKKHPPLPARPRSQGAL